LYFTRILNKEEDGGFAVEDGGFAVGKVGGKAGAAGATELEMEEVIEIEGGEIEIALVPILRW
jgi:L-ascorbate metabolism protein UlaG (beta-lactamase superfamily)